MSEIGRKELDSIASPEPEPDEPALEGDVEGHRSSSIFAMKSDEGEGEDDGDVEGHRSSSIFAMKSSDNTE